MRPRLSSVDSGRPQPRRIFKPVVRPRVSQLLDSAHRYPVTVLVAGAGYGKSVALDHWLASLQEDVVRYDILEDTRGIFDFALEFAMARAPKVELGVEAAANAVNSIEKSTSPDIDLASWLANALRKFEGTIVLDDFHVAATMIRQCRTCLHTSGGLSPRELLCGLPISSWTAYGQSQMAICAWVGSVPTSAQVAIASLCVNVNSCSPISTSCTRRREVGRLHSHLPSRAPNARSISMNCVQRRNNFPTSISQSR